MVSQNSLNVPNGIIAQDIAMPAALGTVKIRGPACEGKLERNLCNVGALESPREFSLLKAGG